MQDIIDRHERIALQLSGGKDGLACLYLCAQHLDKITVYWCNTGDAYPETVEAMAQIRAMVPNFVEIAGNQPGVVNEFGIPTDILPASATPIGVANGGVAMQDRYSCCLRSYMVPLHQRMIDDGITLIIRGQKNSDAAKGPLRSGDVDGGIEYLFPVEEWSDSRVLDFLKEHDAPVPRFYEVLDSAPDCMTCSAWWDTGATKYLRIYHKDAFDEVQRRLDIIRGAVSGHIAHFNEEVL